MEFIPDYVMLFMMSFFFYIVFLFVSLFFKHRYANTHKCFSLSHISETYDIEEMECMREDDLLFSHCECKCFYMSVSEKEKQLDKFDKCR